MSDLIECDVAVEADIWASVENLGELIERAFDAVIASEAMENEHEAWTISLLLTDDAAMQVLNRDWRQKDAPTNVLSFPAADSPRIEGQAAPLGDIAMGYETLKREAIEQSKSFHDHMSHLLVHGLLHLLGYDHIDDGEAEEMEALETAILGGLGIADPYGVK